MQTIKAKLTTLLQRDYSSIDEMNAAIAPLQTQSILQALDIIKSPKEALVRLLELVRKLRGEIAERVHDKRESLLDVAWSFDILLTLAVFRTCIQRPMR